jgi:tetratricopeptide (TPR) repeat protein
MIRIAAAVLLLSLPAFGQVAEGDALYARRAEGHQGARASARNIDAAIAAYQRAVAASPDDLQSSARLLRAIRYKGAYVASTGEEKKAVFAEGKRASEQALTALEKKLQPRRTKAWTEQDVARAATGLGVPFAADIYYWDSVLWGEWALAYGKMAALREGAADRIRRSATISRLIDPKLDGAGAARVLGRLHNQTPRVPLVTGWASDAEAVKFLRESLAADPSVKVTRVFLAEALLAADKRNRTEAVRLLREVINSPNDPDYIVEALSAQDDARALLKKWGEGAR